jgi:hypothetical protein
MGNCRGELDTFTLSAIKHQRAIESTCHIIGTYAGLEFHLDLLANEGEGRVKVEILLTL